MRIVSWNINSVRLREPLVCSLSNSSSRMSFACRKPNVRMTVPEKAFKKAGFAHIAKNGIKGYHGVATLSKHPFISQNYTEFCGKQDGRHMQTVIDYRGAPLAIEIFMWAGGDEPDPTVNEKFDHKLKFLKQMAKQFKAADKPRRLLCCWAI